MSEVLNTYRSIFVVSDLHLGGRLARVEIEGKTETRDIRTFFESDALAWLVEQARRESLDDEKAPVALVLNGDIIDFLALEAAALFDAHHATDKLQAVLDDPQLAAFWDALRSYLADGGGDLVLVLGNHDVELALSSSKQLLLQSLTQGVPQRRAKVRFAMDGAGFRCAVGGANVLCLHGNESDAWNVVDFPRLGLVKRALSHDSILPPWKANAGTTLVIEVMNALKPRYQWIDLLKPEQEATLMVLAALDRRFVPKLSAIADIAVHGVRDTVKRSLDLLGDEPPREETEAKRRDLRVRLARYAGSSTTTSSPTEAAALEKARKNLAKGVDPLTLVDEDVSEEEMLGLSDLWKTAVNFFKLRFAPQDLRKVLAGELVDDTSFSPTAPDDAFEALDEAVGSAIHFLVAGHTHHEKALRRRNGPGFYFNTGTWTRLIHLEQRDLKEPHFEKIRAALEDGGMDSLEQKLQLAGSEPRPLARTRRTVVIIRDRGAEGVVGALEHVRDDGQGGFALELVAGTEMTYKPGS